MFRRPPLPPPKLYLLLIFPLGGEGRKGAALELLLLASVELVSWEQWQQWGVGGFPQKQEWEAIVAISAVDKPSQSRQQR